MKQSTSYWVHVVVGSERCALTNVSAPLLRTVVWKRMTRSNPKSILERSTSPRLHTTDRWRRSLVAVISLLSLFDSAYLAGRCCESTLHVGEPGMSPLRLEEEVNTAFNSGQTYRQVSHFACCDVCSATLDTWFFNLQGHPKPQETQDAHLR